MPASKPNAKLSQTALSAPFSNLLGGLTPAEFMRQYWHKKPLLIRGALGAAALAEYAGLDFAGMAALAGQKGVESRCITQLSSSPKNPNWRLEHGRFGAAHFKNLHKARAPWTLLVQGVNLHEPPTARLLDAFGFIPRARLDDIMVSYAVPGGGVGPHFDSYDVFLLQTCGQRRWRISQQADLSLVPDMPLKILRNFQAEQEWVLNPGDMLYLPPHVAHDGVAVNEAEFEAKVGAKVGAELECSPDCMTYSIGFRAPTERELLHVMLDRALDRLHEDAQAAEQEGEDLPNPRYADPQQTATQPRAADDAHGAGRIPVGLQAFNATAVAKQLDTDALNLALGEYLTEPKPSAVFKTLNKNAAKASLNAGSAETLRLAAGSTALYDSAHFFFNGEAFAFADMQPQDADWLRQLADARCLKAESFNEASQDLKETLKSWLGSGELVLEHFQKA